MRAGVLRGGAVHRVRAAGLAAHRGAAEGGHQLARAAAEHPRGHGRAGGAPRRRGGAHRLPQPRVLGRHPDRAGAVREQGAGEEGAQDAPHLRRPARVRQAVPAAHHQPHRLGLPVVPSPPGERVVPNGKIVCEE